jgi:PPOX class probable F420-dependent enzyme
VATLTEGQGRFLHEEPHVAVVATLRADGTAHQTVIWIDWDGEHVLLNLNTSRTKLGELEADPRVSILVLDKDDPFRWLAVEGRVTEITKEGAYEHIVRQAGVYLGRDSYTLKEGEERVLVRVRPERVEGHNV